MAYPGNDIPGLLHAIEENTTGGIGGEAATYDTNAGATGADTLRVVLASDSPGVGGGGGGGAVTVADAADVTQGALADAAVAAGAAGSVSAKLRRLTTDMGTVAGVSKGAGVSDATTQRVVLASDGPTVSVLGTTADAVVITDANGSLSAKLRGLVKWAFERMPASLGQKTMAASLPVVFASDQSPLAVTGAGGGTQYTEADTDASITGTAVMWEDAADTLRAVSAAKPLPVNVISGATAGTQYTEADTDATITGTAMLWEDAADTLRAVSAAKPLPTVQTGALPAGTNNIGDVDVLTLPVAFNAGAASATTLRTIKSSDSPDIAQFGAVTETAPASDTASSGLNGRLQRIAQRLTALLGQLPASPGAKTSAGSMSVVLANDHGAITVTDNSAWQYQEGDVDAALQGYAFMWEDAADTLRSVSAAKPLPVNVITGSAAGTQYTEADTDATITGTAMMWEDTSDTLRAVSAAKPLPVQQAQLTAANDTVVTVSKGPPSYANAQVATSTTAATLIASRATRRQVYVRNLDAAISVYIGAATVTAANGMLLKAGEGMTIRATGLVQAIAASGTPTMAYLEEYD